MGSQTPRKPPNGHEIHYHSVFNQTIRLYRESHMKYMVRNQDRPNNTPLYSIHSNLDSFILYNEDDINEQVNEKEEEQDL